MRLAALREEPEAVANDDRGDPLVELVDEVALEEPAEETPLPWTGSSLSDPLAHYVA